MHDNNPHPRPARPRCPPRARAHVHTCRYGGLLASATDPTNLLYWAKVFRFANTDTSRWLAALSLAGVQVGTGPARVRSRRVARATPPRGCVITDIVCV